MEIGSWVETGQSLEGRGCFNLHLVQRRPSITDHNLTNVVPRLASWYLLVHLNLESTKIQNTNFCVNIFICVFACVNLSVIFLPLVFV